MSDVASLELRVTTSGVEAAAQHLRHFTDEGTKAEGAGHRCASSVEQLNASAKKTQDTLARLNASVSQTLTSDINRLASTYRSAASKMTLPGQTGELPASLAGGIGEKATASLQMWRKAQSDVVIAEAAMVAKMREADAAANDKTGAFGKLAAGAKGLVLPLVAVGSAVGAANKVMAETIAYENLTARLSGITGGAEEAKEAFALLEKMSDKTIFTENQMTEAFLRLEQTGLDGSERALKAFADIASETGNSMEQLAEMTLSASMGIFRSMRSMGIRAEADGNKVRMTFRGVTTTIGNSAQEIQEYLVKIGETHFAGAAERQLDTMGGQLKELKDAWGDLFREVGQSVVGDLIKTSMGAATDVVHGLTAAVEGLLYTMSKKPKEMSADKKAILAGFLSEEEWGSAKKTIEERYADLMKWQEAAFSNKDQQKALEEYRARVKEIKELSLEAMQAGYAFDARTMLASAEEEYTRKAGGKGTAAEDAAKKAMEEAKRKAKAADDFFVHLRDLNAKAKEEFVKESDSQAEAYAQQLKQLDDFLASEEEKIRDGYRERAAIIEVGQEEEEGPFEVGQSMTGGRKDLLRARNEKKLAEELNALRNAETQKREALYDGMRTEEEELRQSYERRLKDIEEYTKKDIGFAMQAEELKAKLYQKYAQDQQQLSLAQIAQGAQNAEALFGSLSEVARNWGGEQSDMYRVMFAAQKAFATASAIVAGGQAMAEAMKLGWPAGIPAGIAAMAQVARAMAIISSANYSGAYDRGGFIPSGSVGLVGERGPELVRGPATVTGREATARAMGGPVQIRIVNAPDQVAASQFLTSSAGEQLIMNVVRRNSNSLRTMAR